MSPKSSNLEKYRGAILPSPLSSSGQRISRCEACRKHLDNFTCPSCDADRKESVCDPGDFPDVQLEEEEIRPRRTKIKRARTSVVQSRERHNLERSLFSKTHGCPGPGQGVNRDYLSLEYTSERNRPKGLVVSADKETNEDLQSPVTLELRIGRVNEIGNMNVLSEIDITKFSSTRFSTRLWEHIQRGQDAARIICVDGSPASGKTHLLWNASQYIKKSAQDELIVATLFHSRDREFNPKVMYDRLALQIRQQCTPGLLRQIDVEGLKLGRPSSHQQKWNLWRQILKMVSLQKPILLVLDGLPADDIFQRFTLREILQLCAKSPNIKCIVSSRNGQAAGLCNGIPLNLVSHISLDHDEEIRRDIGIPVTALLDRACSQSDFGIDSDEIFEFTEAIMKKSGGTYLATEILINYVLQSMGAASSLAVSLDIGAVIKSLPDVDANGIQSLYDYSLDNVPESFLSLAKELLSWCLSLKRRMTKMELIEILNLKDNPEAEPVIDEDLTDYCDQRIRKLGGCLVKFDDNDYAKFAHGSVKDHLLGTKSRFGISTFDANEAVAITAINYLSNCNLRIDFQSECKHRRSVSEYMVIYMPEHCEQIEQENSSVPGFLLHFMKERFSKFKVWMELYAELKQIPLPKFRKGEYLRICATFGFFTLTKMLIDLGVDPNGMPNRRTPLEAAIENKHTKIAKLLIENGAHRRRARTW